MPLSIEDIGLNKAIAKDLAETEFNTLENKDDLANSLNIFADQQHIPLFTYRGERHRNNLVLALKKAIQNNRFVAELVTNPLMQWKNTVLETERQTRNRFLNQVPERAEPSLVEQLATRGHTNPAHYVLHKEIKEILDSIPIQKPDVRFLDPISLTDNTHVLVDALESFKNIPGQLLIPVNLDGVHWVLFNRVIDDKGVHMTIVDSKDGENRDVTAFTSQYKEAIKAVHREFDFEYVFTNEQFDSYTCGDRVVQKALILAGSDHPFTKIDVRNPTALREGFTNLAVACDKRDRDFQVQMQIQKDELLAIVLQDLYQRDGEIDSEDAINKAKEELASYRLDELVKKKTMLIQSIDYYKNNLFQGQKQRTESSSKKDNHETDIEESQSTTCAV